MPNKDNNSSPIKTTNSTVVYKNKWITIHEDSVTFPSGSIGIYGYLESKNSVMMVAANSKNEIYLVKAYRHPSKSWGWELPGGSTDGEDYLQAAQRELEEETGLKSTEWTILGSPVVCNGLMTERMAVALALNCKPIGTEANDDETFIDKGFFSIAKIKDMIRNEDIDDSQTLSSLHLYELWREDNV